MSEVVEELSELGRKYMNNLLLKDVQSQAFILICDNANIRDLEELFE